MTPMTTLEREDRATITEGMVGGMMGGGGFQSMEELEATNPKMKGAAAAVSKRLAEMEREEAAAKAGSFDDLGDDELKEMLRNDEKKEL